MSASNWTICPRCKRRHEADATRLRAEADAAYGNMQRDEWMALDTKAREAGFAYTPTDFREDYEIHGATEGAIKIDYAGTCRKCKLSVSLDHAHPIDGIDD